jgi:hypothetical protein
MYNICPHSPWIKSYGPWSFDPPVPGLQEKILVRTHLKLSKFLGNPSIKKFAAPHSVHPTFSFMASANYLNVISTGTT